MCDFNPKNVSIGSGVDKTKFSSFWPFGLQSFKTLIAHVRWAVSDQSIGPKEDDDDFLFWSTPELMVTFLGLKNNTSH